MYKDEVCGNDVACPVYKCLQARLKYQERKQKIVKLRNEIRKRMEAKK